MPYLTQVQRRALERELELFFSLPYAAHLAGTAWEEMLARAKGGQWTEMRDNRPRPDLVVQEGTARVNYSVKAEVLRPRSEATRAEDFLGQSEDLIVARPKVDSLLGQGQQIGNLSADQLGSLVLRYYNEQIVRAYGWHVLAILFRVGGRNEFIYFEQRPPETYNPADYWWKDSGRATGSNRNINGYPNCSPRNTLERAKFKWTSGGKQFYVLYEIPTDADILRIDPAPLSPEEITEAIQEYRARRRR